MGETFTIRPATPDEADQVAWHRHRMFADIRDYPPGILPAMEAVYRVWVKEKLTDGQYLAWFAVDEADEVVGGVGLWLIEWPPHPWDLTRRRGHVLDMYMRPEYRRRGLAHRLMQAVVAWCEAQGIVFITLDASPFGRPLYASFGFQDMDMMWKRLS